MKTIWKYAVPVQDEFEIEMPMGSQVLSVQTQGSVPRIWVLVNPEEKAKLTRRFRVVGTGHEIEEEHIEFIDTFQVNGGQYIFHVFEIMFPYDDEL
jgi:hypothetical protein